MFSKIITRTLEDFHLERGGSSMVCMSISDSCLIEVTSIVATCNCSFVYGFKMFQLNSTMLHQRQTNTKSLKNWTPGRHPASLWKSCYFPGEQNGNIYMNKNRFFCHFWMFDFQIPKVHTKFLFSTGPSWIN